jgi:sulfur relay (sulfurtransferase) DsrC/TusE family protein
MDIEKEINKHLEEFYKKVNQNLENASDECAELLREELSKEAKKVIKKPKTYYKNFVIQKYERGFLNYVGNTTKTKDGIPLSNLLESGATRVKRGYMKPRPHFKKAYDRMENEMIRRIEERIDKK